MTEFHPLPSLKDRQQADNSEWESYNQAAEQLAQSQPSAPLPSLSHLTFRDYQTIYEPAEDTYLLLDCLQYVLTNQVEYASSIQVCVEIGCGTAVATRFVQSRKLSASYIVTDINPVALQTVPWPSIERVQCDLSTALRLSKSVDLLLFNPPYVPTPDDELYDNDILSKAWAGGALGRRVTDRFVPEIHSLLSDTGRCYMVTVDDNRPSELAETLLRDHSLTMRPLFRRRARNEYLTIQEITRNKKINK